MELAMVDGTIMPIQEARISIHDRSVSFGDGIYEVLVCREGIFFEWDRHIERLQRSLREMDMIQSVDLEQIVEYLRHAVTRADLSQAVVYLQISRDRALRNHDYSSDCSPGCFLTVREYHLPQSDQGAAITYPDLRWKRCDIKSLNLLPNIMAKHAAHQAGASEAILVDDNGWVTEGSCTSVLMVKQGTIYLPPLTVNILPGITRSLLLDWARQHSLPVEQQLFAPSQALDADELMIAGTTTTVMAITQLDGQTIANGNIGPVTSLFRQQLHEAITHIHDHSAA